MKIGLTSVLLAFSAGWGAADGRHVAAFLCLFGAIAVAILDARVERRKR